MATCDYTTTGSSTGDSWGVWTNAGTSTTGTAYTWGLWTGTASTTTANVTNIYQSASVYQSWKKWTADELKQYQEQVARAAAEAKKAAAEYEKRAAEAAKKAKEVIERATALLHRYMDEEQKKQLASEGQFVVESESGKKYVIKKGRQGNVYSLDEHRKQIARHCIHPIDLVPDQDTMLAQLLWLKWNEEEFLKVANTTPLQVAA